MRLSSSSKHQRHRGMTFIELTLVIGVMMTLISLLFIGARAWRTGSDRSQCIMNIRTVQLAMRSHQNLYGYSYGSEISSTESNQNIVGVLYDGGYIDERLYTTASGGQTCPGGGTYLIENPTIFPEEGSLFMTCSLSESLRHEPENHDSW